jgi:outer membrane lipoprotein-sorting protein
MNQEQDIQRLLNAMAESEVPDGSLDLAARVRQQSPAPRLAMARRSRRRVFRPVLALGLLALVAFGAWLLPFRAASVSAQEALQRAEHATAFGLDGVDSFHGVLEVAVPATGDVTREEIWIKQPGQLRKELIWPDAVYETHLLDGDAAWAWTSPGPDSSVVDGTISRLAPADLAGALHVVPNPSASLDTPDQPDAGLCAQPGDQLSLLGEETQLGRPTLVIECVIGPSDANAGTRLKLWIDKQIFVVIKYEHYESTGELFVESHFTQFELNPAIPAERFALPAGAPIEGDS